MTCNVGKKDRVLRFVGGLVILGLGFYFQSYWGLVGLIPLATATFRWCPLYIPIKLNTEKFD